ncbi:MAG: alcohol dehydrogenase catalytic domain-containing protein, partial [Acidimicrobiales bacterium]
MVRAAVLEAIGQPLAIRHLDLAPPGAGEIKVRMLAAGVCRSDLSVQRGTIPSFPPVVAGHEGAGVVDEVGEAVDGFSRGDHVVISWIPQCGACGPCRRGRPHLCEASTLPLLTGGLLDGTPRFTMGGRPVRQLLCAGTFAEATVVPAISAARVPATLDPAVAALVGCSVLTGVGAALNTATIRPGDTVAVIGCGGVGLNVVQG